MFNTYYLAFFSFVLSLSFFHPYINIFQSLSLLFFCRKILHTELHRLSNGIAVVGRTLTHSFRHDGWFYIVNSITFTKNYTAHGRFFRLLFSLSHSRSSIFGTYDNSCEKCNMCSLCMSACVCVCLLNKSADFLGFFLCVEPHLFVCCCRLPIYFALICFYFNFVYFALLLVSLNGVFGWCVDPCLKCPSLSSKLIRGNLSITITFSTQHKQQQQQQQKHGFCLVKAFEWTWIPYISVNGHGYKNPTEVHSSMKMLKYQ